MTAQEQYISDQYLKLDQYVNGVQNGSIIANKQIKQAVDRYQKDLNNPLYEFRKDKLDKFFYFLYYVKLLQSNNYIQFQPEPWQVFYFANVYGFYLADTEIRRFTTSFITISRKNGKTSIAAIQSLYHLIYDGNIDAQVYFISKDRALANNGLRIAKNITKNSPALNKRTRVMQYSIKYETKATDNFMVAMPGEPDALNSIRPSFGIIDESHTFVNSDLPDMLKSGQVGVNNPLMSIISTRGYNTLGYYQYDYEQYLKQVLEGEKEDASTFIMMFGLDSEEEISKPEMWVKANPNLTNPNILTLDELKREYEQKRYRISGLRNFAVFNLNLWWELSEDSFIPNDVLNKVWGEVEESELQGNDCYLGIDLSSTKDITAISLIFPPTPERMNFAIKNFNIKTNSVEKRVRKSGIDLTPWIDSGEILELDTPIIDYDYLFELIQDLSEKYNILSIGYDKFNSALLIPKVRNELGLECEPIPQTASFLNQSIKFLEKLVYDEAVIIDNEATKWQFGNIKLYIDGNGNYKFMKNKSLDSIDSPVAIVTGLAAWLNTLNEEELNYIATSI